ncbi:MAG: AI-2E family transporter [Rudaea sp.]
MIQRSAWLNILIILLVIIAGSYVAQMSWSLLAQFSDIILLFVLAWLVSFAFSPIIERISGQPLPPELVRFGARANPQVGRALERFRYTRLLAVAIVYIGLAMLLVFGIAALVPPTIIQVNQFADQLTNYAGQAPAWADQLQRLLTSLGIRTNVEAALATLAGNLQNIASPVLQNMIGLLGSILSIVANLLFVLILSFFLSLDGPRLLHTIYNVVPSSMDEEVQVLTITIDRAFGGFIRAQLLQGLLIGVGTAVVTILFDQPFVLVSSLFAGLFMLIPFVGAPLALLPPLLTALLHDYRQIPFSVGILLIYQVIVANVVTPKILSDALGLHPLVIIASILIGIKVGGFWGAFFGVPVAGVIATMVLFFYRRWLRLRTVGGQSNVRPAAEAAPSNPRPQPASPLPTDLERLAK